MRAPPRTWLSLSGPSRRIQSYTLPPLMYSNTMHRLGRRVHAPINCTTFLCRTCAEGAGDAAVRELTADLLARHALAELRTRNACNAWVRRRWRARAAPQCARAHQQALRTRARTLRMMDTSCRNSLYCAASSCISLRILTATSWPQ